MDLNPDIKYQIEPKGHMCTRCNLHTEIRSSQERGAGVDLSESRPKSCILLSDVQFQKHIASAQYELYMKQVATICDECISIWSYVHDMSKSLKRENRLPVAAAKMEHRMNKRATRTTRCLLPTLPIVSLSSPSFPPALELELGFMSAYSTRCRCFVHLMRSVCTYLYRFRVIEKSNGAITP